MVSARSVTRTEVNVGVAAGLGVTVGVGVEVAVVGIPARSGGAGRVATTIDRAIPPRAPFRARPRKREAAVRRGMFLFRGYGSRFYCRCNILRSPPVVGLLCLRGSA